MTGRCASGAEADGGSIFHAVNEHGHTFSRAACGAKPGKRGNGWGLEPGTEVNCPRCLVRVSEIGKK